MMRGQVRRTACASASDVRFLLSGEFDFYNKLELAGALGSHMTYRTVTLDFAQMRFIDAGVLGVLARFAGLRRKQGAAQLRLVNLDAQFRRIFSICRLDAAFRIQGPSARGETT